MSESSVQLSQIMPFILERLSAGESVKFTPHGTSMKPMILGGRDQVVLSPAPKQWKKYDLPFYQRDNGQYVLHRIVKVGETITCIGDNQFEYERDLRQDQMIAIATGFVRKGKEHRTDRLSYRIYCRCWHWSRGIRHFFLRIKWKMQRMKKSVQ